jgi:hypothetical protein
MRIIRVRSRSESVELCLSGQGDQIVDRCSAVYFTGAEECAPCIIEEVVDQGCSEPLLMSRSGGR